MPQPSDLDVPPPADWQKFERMTRDLFEAEWASNAHMNGRTGQPQHGVDVYGQPGSAGGAWHGVQCKKKDNLADKSVTPAELEAEVKKARQFKPSLAHFVLATTGPRDADVQETARLLTDQHRAKGLFWVEVVFWPDFLALYDKHLDVFRRHYADFNAASAQAAPHALPAPPADFVGREGELAELRRAVEQMGEGVVISCHGMGGVGKTALALVLGHELAGRYPDGQVFVDLAGTSDRALAPAEAMSRVIRWFRPPAEKLPEELAELAPLYNSVLAGRKVLILADNAADEKQVGPLLPPPSCLLLVTTRKVITLPGCHGLTLKKLPRHKACELLLKIAGRIGGEADRIAGLCGDLPLALRAAASLLSVTPDLAPAAYAGELEDERTRLEKLGQEGVEISIEASFELSHRRLSAEAAAVLGRLAVFPATFDAAAEEAVCRDDGHKHLSALVRMSMVEFNEDTGRYNLHDLVRLFARRKLRDAQECHAAERRHAVHYVRVAALAHKVFLGKEPDANVRGLRLFDGEWENIKAGQGWSAARRTGDADAAGLCSAYPGVAVYCLSLRLHAKDRIAWLEAALEAAGRIPDRKAEGGHLGNLGLAYADLGEVRKAIYYHEKALVIDREIGDRRGEGTAVGNLGLAYAALGEVRKAIEYYEKALVIDRETSDRRGEGADLGNLGNAYAALGEVRKAIEHHEKYLAIAREIGDRSSEGNTLGNLGSAYLRLGEVRKAIEYYEKCLVIHREIGDRRGEGNDLWNLALALRELKEPAKALDLARQALAIYEAIEDPWAAKVRKAVEEWGK